MSKASIRRCCALPLLKLGKVDGAVVSLEILGSLRITAPPQLPALVGISNREVLSTPRAERRESRWCALPHDARRAVKWSQTDRNPVNKQTKRFTRLVRGWCPAA